MMKRGFTLIEVCVVVGILLLLVSLTLPSFNKMLLNHRLDRDAHLLALTLTQARQLAFQNQEPVLVFLDSEKKEVRVQLNSGKEIIKKLNRSLKIESTAFTFSFQNQTVPSREEIRVIAQNGAFRQLTVEPFLRYVQVQ